MSKELIVPPAPEMRPAPLFTPTPKAARRVLEFFTAQINNDHTRKAYLDATRRFAEWCDRRSIMPLTMEQYARSLKEPALCKQLNIHDLLDDVAVQLNGSLVAGFELSGLHSYCGSDEERNRTKGVAQTFAFQKVCGSSDEERKGGETLNP